MPPRTSGCQKAINSSTEISLVKDLQGIKEQLPLVEVRHPTPGNLAEFTVAFTVVEGAWNHGRFVFKFYIPNGWPFERPTVKILTRVYHPNIQEIKDQITEGAVCLNILRENYTPAITLPQIIVGLQYLFADPNPTSPLNAEAAEEYLKNMASFRLKVRDYIDQYCPK